MLHVSWLIFHVLSIQIDANLKCIRFAHLAHKFQQQPKQGNATWNDDITVTSCGLLGEAGAAGSSN